MNPLSNVRFIKQLNEKEAKIGIKESASWHNQYKGSAWIFVGGLAYELTEGDVVCVFSQYGEIVNINLIRDKGTGKSKGYCFICYEDQRSTTLAVDNFNGIKLCNRIIRVDHVADYKIPKDHKDTDDVTKKLRWHGCAPEVMVESNNDVVEIPAKKIKKEKSGDAKKKKKTKKKKKEKRSETPESSSSSEEDIVIKKEKHDPDYDKYLHPSNSRFDENSRGQTRKSSNDTERSQHKSRTPDVGRRQQASNTDRRHLNDYDDSSHYRQAKEVDRRQHSDRSSGYQRITSNERQRRSRSRSNDVGDGRRKYRDDKMSYQDSNLRHNRRSRSPRKRNYHVRRSRSSSDDRRPKAYRHRNR